MTERSGNARAPRHGKPYEGVLDLVGWTPLVRLKRVAQGIRTPVYGKAEFMNPGGSVKDRIGLAMIETAEEAGLLKPGGTIVEGTSGNTGLALGNGGRHARLPLHLHHPRQDEPREGQAAAAPSGPRWSSPRPRCRRTTRNTTSTGPGRSPRPRREASWRTSSTTAPIPWPTTGPPAQRCGSRRTGRSRTSLPARAPGGRSRGAGRYLKERNPDVRVIGVDPVGSVLSGFYRTGTVGRGEPYKVEGLGNDKVPGTLDIEYIDDYCTVTDGEAFAMARRLVAEEGLFVGGSTGLIVHAALAEARRLDDPNACVVAILCDWGERYLTKQYDDEWMRNNGFLAGPRATVAEMVAAKLEPLPGLLTVTPSTPVRMAISTLSSHHVSQLPVVVNGECIGSVAERKLMSAVLADPEVLEHEIESVMEAPYPVLDEHADAEAATRLLSGGAQAVLVRANGALDGILTRHDLVRALAAAP